MHSDVTSECLRAGTPAAGTSRCGAPAAVVCKGDQRWPDGQRDAPEGGPYRDRVVVVSYLPFSSFSFLRCCFSAPTAAPAAAPFLPARMPPTAPPTTAP